MNIIVTGGAGFIGSALVRRLLELNLGKVLNLDKLTYAGNLESLELISSHSDYSFEQVDIRDKKKLQEVVDTFRPNLIFHLAAESHVDRSIDGPADFIDTNILGTYNLLEVSRNYWQNSNNKIKNSFLFHHVSTDEVYGDLKETSDLFSEESSYDPSSPYSASKAASDHLVRAWYRTYGLPIILTNCSNNYGPYQFPEKLIPHVIINALNGKPIPVYGDGSQIRDWLYVDDHVDALIAVAQSNTVGQTFNIGGHNEVTNLDVVNKICELLEEFMPAKPNGLKNYKDLITFVSDRPGHDYRYAIDASKIKNSLGWIPKESFNSGLRKTVEWYLDNKVWWKNVLSGDYRLSRLGSGR